MKSLIMESKKIDFQEVSNFGAAATSVVADVTEKGAQCHLHSLDFVRNEGDRHDKTRL